MLLASDVSAFAHHTQKVVYLNDSEIVTLSPDRFELSTISQEDVEAVVHSVDWKIEESELGEFAHYMEKEIFDQPVALKNAVAASTRRKGRPNSVGST